MASLPYVQFTADSFDRDRGDGATVPAHHPQAGVSYLAERNDPWLKPP
jgi:hypothetical protein